MPRWLVSKSHIFFWLKWNVSLNLAFNYISFSTSNKQIFIIFPMKKVIFCELLLWKQPRTKLYLGNFLLFVLIKEVHPLCFQWLYQMAKRMNAQNCFGWQNMISGVSGFFLMTPVQCSSFIFTDKWFPFHRVNSVRLEIQLI